MLLVSLLPVHGSARAGPTVYTQSTNTKLALPSTFFAFSALQVTGHKLRLNVPDTAIIEHGLLKAWLYTDKKTGVVQSTPSSSLSCTALLHKLKGQHALHDLNNPNGWVAVAYFNSYVTRLLNAQELEQLVSNSAQLPADSCWSFVVIQSLKRAATIGHPCPVPSVIEQQHQSLLPNSPTSADHACLLHPEQSCPEEIIAAACAVHTLVIYLCGCSCRVCMLGLCLMGRLQRVKQMSLGCSCLLYR